MAVSGQFLLLMAIIKKIKLPNEATARDIGANSSNIIYDGDAGTTTTLNEKIQSIFTAIGDINSFEIAIVNELPATGDDHTIYFVPEFEGSTSHNEYMYIDNHWELIGSTTIDLSNYLQKSDITIAQGLTTGVPAATITVGATTTTIYTTDDNIFIATYNVTTAEELESAISAGKTIYCDYNGKRYIYSYKVSNPVTYWFTLPTYSGINFAGFDYIKFIAPGFITAGWSTGSYYLKQSDWNETSNISSAFIKNKPTIPTVTPVAALTTGVTIGSIDVSGTTTVFYAPEDTKVKQNDITGSTETLRHPILISSQGKSLGTITDEAVKSDSFTFLPSWNALVVTGNGTQMNGIIGINEGKSNHNLVQLFPSTYGTSTTPGVAILQLGNQYSTADGDGNSKGGLVIFGEGNWQNQLFALDNRTTEGNAHNYTNYLPMTDGVLAAGVTTGVGSSTVPVYMAAGGELLACTLPTPPTYTLSMTGPTINLLADGVAASTITLPIWDGTLD